MLHERCKYSGRSSGYIGEDLGSNRENIEVMGETERRRVGTGFSLSGEGRINVKLWKAVDMDGGMEEREESSAM